MQLCVRGRAFAPGDFAIMTDGVVEGADIVEVAPDPEVIAAIRTKHPALVIAVAPSTAEPAAACVRAGADVLSGEDLAGVAAATGAALICSAPERATGVRPDGLLVRARDPREAERLARAGHAVLVDDPELAVVSVYAWVGARVFRTGSAGDTRQALDMVASIRGTRPPTVSRRGLT